MSSKPTGGLAVALAVHRCWARHIYKIHFATRSATVTLKVNTGRHSDDTMSLQLTTMHAPSLLNHTPGELDVAWHEVAHNLKGNRSIRILLADANCELSRARGHDHDDDAARATRDDDDTRSPHDAIPAPTDTTTPTARTNGQAQQHKRAKHARNEQARTTWAHLKGMNMRPCNAYATWWDTCHRHYLTDDPDYKDDDRERQQQRHDTTTTTTARLQDTPRPHMQRRDARRGNSPPAQPATALPTAHPHTSHLPQTPRRREQNAATAMATPIKTLPPSTTPLALHDYNNHSSPNTDAARARAAAPNGRTHTMGVSTGQGYPGLPTDATASTTTDATYSTGHDGHDLTTIPAPPPGNHQPSINANTPTTATLHQTAHDPPPNHPHPTEQQQTHDYGHDHARDAPAPQTDRRRDIPCRRRHERWTWTAAYGESDTTTTSTTSASTSDP